MFSIPSVVDADVLQILRTDPSAIRIRLHVDHYGEPDDFSPELLLPSDFNGVAWEEKSDVGWTLPDEEAPDQALVMSDKVTWEKTVEGNPQTVGGYSLWLVEGETQSFLCAEQFEQPLPMNAVGDKIERFFQFDLDKINLE